MFGALLVIYGHSSPLVGTGDLFPANWAVQPEKGVLMGFFAMSGFQIAESWMRDPHPLRFAAKRVLRLWPPMLVVVLVSALVIGPLVTDLPTGAYFSDPATWGYILRNAGMLTLVHVLPGVFVHNPWPIAVNGSLWTLPMELLAYAGLFVLLLMGAATRRRRWLIVAAAMGMVIWDRYLDHTPGVESAGSWLSIPVESFVAFVTAFGIGVILCVYRIPLSPTAALVGLAVLFLSPNSEAASFWMRFAVSYAVILVAHYWPARLKVPSLWVNGSYGVYVWGFPIQQLLALAGIRNQFLMLACAAPLAYVMGTLSWKFVEEPTMRLRHFIAPERPKAVDDTPEPAEDGPPDEDGRLDEGGQLDEVPPDFPARDFPAGENPARQAPARENPAREAPVERPKLPMAAVYGSAAGQFPPRPPGRVPPPSENERVQPSNDNETTQFLPRMPRRYVAEESPLTRRLPNNGELPPAARLPRTRGRHAAVEPGPPAPEEETNPMPPSPRRFDRR